MKHMGRTNHGKCWAKTAFNSTTYTYLAKNNFLTKNLHPYNYCSNKNPTASTCSETRTTYTSTRSIQRQKQLLKS
eukprot:2427237-Amphidinium_carterae.1